MYEDRRVWVGATASVGYQVLIYFKKYLPLNRFITALDAEGRLLDE